MKKITILFLLFITTGCHPSSMQDCQHEAKKVIIALTADLREVQTCEDLLNHEDQVKQKIQTLVNLMIQLKKLQDRGNAIPEAEDSSVSDALMQEMKRIYYLEGGRELFEQFEREALLKLDAFDQKRKK